MGGGGKCVCVKGRRWEREEGVCVCGRWEEVVVMVVRTDDLTHVSPYESVEAAQKGGRTPGSQTPGVPATLALNVLVDGVRKMPQK